MSEATSRGQFQSFDASNYRVGIVVAQFNHDVTDELLSSALAKAGEYKIPEKNISVHKVAGSVEFPVVLDAMAKSKKFDCLVALGSIIRGETAHFDYVCKIASEGIREVTVKYGIPIGFGVLTCDNKQQAKARLSFGSHAMEAALQAAKTVKEILK